MLEAVKQDNYSNIKNTLKQLRRILMKSPMAIVIFGGASVAIAFATFSLNQRSTENRSQASSNCSFVASIAASTCQQGCNENADCVSSLSCVSNHCVNPAEPTSPNCTVFPTNTPTLTVTPTSTLTPTLTVTPSRTLTPTRTVTPTITNTPTATVTPQTGIVTLVPKLQDIANQDGKQITIGSRASWVGVGQDVNKSYLGLRFTSGLPTAQQIKKAELEFKVVDNYEQWINVGFVVRAEVPGSRQAFSSTALLSTRSLLSTSKAYKDNVKWLANKPYRYDITSVMKSGLSTQSDTLVLILKGNDLQWGRKFVDSKNIRLVITLQ